MLTGSDCVCLILILTFSLIVVGVVFVCHAISQAFYYTASKSFIYAADGEHWPCGWLFCVFFSFYYYNIHSKLSDPR